MAAPQIVTCPVDTWVLVAANVTTCQVWENDTSPLYKYTYVDAGDPAPTDDSKAQTLDKSLDGFEFIHSVPSDVYVKATRDAGSVRVES
jgi:hypothetical protein